MDPSCVAPVVGWSCRPTVPDHRLPVAAPRRSPVRPVHPVRPLRRAHAPGARPLPLHPLRAARLVLRRAAPDLVAGAPVTGRAGRPRSRRPARGAGVAGRRGRRGWRRVVDADEAEAVVWTRPPTSPDARAAARRPPGHPVGPAAVGRHRALRRRDRTPSAPGPAARACTPSRSPRRPSPCCSPACGFGTYGRATTWTGPQGRNLSAPASPSWAAAASPRRCCACSAPSASSHRRPPRPAPVDGRRPRRRPRRARRGARGAEVVVVALALTPETTRHHRRRRLDADGRDGWLVNVARGGHVVTDDLVAALADGRSAAPASTSPTPSPCPTATRCGRARTCLITPHVGNTPEMAVPLLSARVTANVGAAPPAGRCSARSMPRPATDVAATSRTTTPPWACPLGAPSPRTSAGPTSTWPAGCTPTAGSTPTTAERAEADRRMRQVNEAWRVLGNPGRRLAYDVERREAGPAGADVAARDRSGSGYSFSTGDLLRRGRRPRPTSLTRLVRALPWILLVGSLLAASSSSPPTPPRTTARRRAMPTACVLSPTAWPPTPTAATPGAQAGAHRGARGGAVPVRAPSRSNPRTATWPCASRSRSRSRVGRSQRSCYAADSLGAHSSVG